MDGLIVLVDAEDREVDVPPGVREVVRIPSEERDPELRGQDEPHVGVLLVPVKVVLAPRVQRDRVAAQSGLLVAFLLELRLFGLLRLEHLGVGHAGLDASVDPGRDVLDPFEHVQLEIRALDFFRGRFRDVTGFDVVALGGRDLLYAVSADVMIGQDEAALGHEGSRPAVVEADRGQPHVVEPGLVRSPAVLLLQRGRGNVVVGPHPLVRERRDGKGHCNRECEQSNLEFHRLSVSGISVPRPAPPAGQTQKLYNKAGDGGLPYDSQLRTTPKTAGGQLESSAEPVSFAALRG